MENQSGQKRAAGDAEELRLKEQNCWQQIIHPV